MNNLRQINWGDEKLKQDNKNWEFENVTVTMRDNKPYKYNVSISARQLAELYADGTLIYDGDVQRGMKMTSKGEVPIIYQSHAKEILSSILDGSIHGGSLSLNFPTEHNENLEYDPDALTLSGNGTLTICDGMHRIYACVLWVKKYSKNPSDYKNPEFFYFPVNIEHISKLESKDLFKEYASTSKAISKNRISVHNVFDKNYALAQRVINESQLKGKIELISNSIKKNSSNILTFGTILNGVSVFEIATKKEESAVGDFIIEFWDELVELFPRLMGNVDPEVRTIEKQKSFALEKMYLNSYFILAKELISKEDWKSKLERLTLDNFLSRKNPIWQSILRDQDKIVNTSVNQKYVTETIVDWVMKEE